MRVNTEIERKYVIKKPDMEKLSAQGEYTVSEITQIYLLSEPKTTHRIRLREYEDRREYTETKKVRIDKMSSYEDEREITESEYRELEKQIASTTRPLKKTRHTLTLDGITYEIDVYPEWHSTCILEIELDSREQNPKIPDFIKIVKEVTGDKRYSNASMSRCFPEELLVIPLS